MAKQPKKQTEKVSDRLRAAVEQSGLPRNQICLQTGIDPAALHRFVHGTGLNLESIDRLCEFFDLRLVSNRTTKKGG